MESTNNQNITELRVVNNIIIIINPSRPIAHKISYQIVTELGARKNYILKCSLDVVVSK